MHKLNLACRLFRIDSQSVVIIKKILEKKSKKSYLYEIYEEGTPQEQKLYFSVKNITKNKLGHLIEIYLDRLIFLPQRDIESQPVKHTPTYFLQLLETPQKFKDHILIFGPQSIDAGIRRAFTRHVSKTQKVSTALIQRKVDFNKIKSLSLEFPNIQHFCVKDITDDRLQDIIVKGSRLEDTVEYSQYAINELTKGEINILGVSVKGKTIYIKKDGSFYSRHNFDKFDTSEVIFSLIERIDKRKGFMASLDDF